MLTTTTDTTIVQGNGTVAARAAAPTAPVTGRGTCTVAQGTAGYRRNRVAATHIDTAWSAIATKSMLVPSFHDRWPLCTT